MKARPVAASPGARGGSPFGTGGIGLANRPQLKRLDYFVAVAKIGSIAGAARMMALTPSTLGHQLRALEDHLGCKLFKRGAHGLVLSESGALFHTHAEKILRGVNDIWADTNGLSCEPEGHVGVGMPPIPAKILAAPLARHVIRHLPHVKLDLKVGYSWDIHEWLEAGHVQLGLFYDGPGTDHTFAKPIFTETLHLIGRSDAAPFIEAISLDALLKLPLIVPSRPHGNRLEIERIAAERGLQINIAMEVNSLSSMIQLIIAGFGYALLPRFAVAEALQRNLLRATPVSPNPIKRTLLLGTSRRRKVSASAQTLMAVVEDLLANQPPDKPPS